jgi:hypothetical protein
LLQNLIAGNAKVNSRLYVIQRAINTKGESVNMDKLKNIFVVLLIAAIVSFGQLGCKQESEHPSGDHPTSEHPASEHPTEETPTEETPSEEHPAGEHPTGEHPK